MPQLGPAYDLAKRLAALEDQVRRLVANQIGQAFSATQSDGSVGMQVLQDPATGGTAMTFYQGPNTPRDASTGQHPELMYVGELFTGNTPQDSGVIFQRPDATQSAVVGNRGVQLKDPHGNQVFTTDEYGTSPSQVGLNTPWIPLGQPISNSAGSTGWPNTTATSSSLVAFLNFPAQHSHITWSGIAFCPSGSAGQVQVQVNNGSAGATHSVGGGYTYLGPETFSLGSSWSWQEPLQVQCFANLTSGAGPVSFAVLGVWGCGAGF